MSVFYTEHYISSVGKKNIIGDGWEIRGNSKGLLHFIIPYSALLMWDFILTIFFLPRRKCNIHRVLSARSSLIKI